MMAAIAETRKSRLGTNKGNSMVNGCTKHEHFYQENRTVVMFIDAIAP
jgi:hypothetical protein